MIGNGPNNKSNKHHNNNDNGIASPVLFIASLPFSWNVNNVKSVMKGTGPIVEVRLRMDNQNKNKGFCFIEYLTPQDALKAIPLILQIKLENGRKRLRVEVSKEPFRKVDPDNPQSNKFLEHLTRDFLPKNVILPSTMVSPDEYNTLQGRIYDVNNDTLGNNNMNSTNNNVNSINNNVSSINNVNNNLNNLNQPMMNLPPQHQFSGNIKINNNLKMMPDNLVNASKVLPPFVKDYFCTDKDAISSNLETVPPPQMIQLIANMKNLLISGNIDSVDNILTLNPDISISVAQVLLLLGFIDNDVITEALSQPSTTTTSPASSPAAAFVQQSNYNGVNSMSQAMNNFNNFKSQKQNQNEMNGIPSSMNPVGPNHMVPSPVMSTPVPNNVVVSSQQDDLQPFARRNKASILQPVRKHLAAPYPSSAQVQPPIGKAIPQNNATMSQPNHPPEWSQFRVNTIQKLQALERTQADNIVKILTLPVEQINMLPPDQQAVVSQLKAEYL